MKKKNIFSKYQAAKFHNMNKNFEIIIASSLHENNPSRLQFSHHNYTSTGFLNSMLITALQQQEDYCFIFTP